MDFYIFGRVPVVTQTGLTELAYLLAGVSMRSRSPNKWPVWYNDGEPRTRALHAQPHHPSYDGLRPLRHLAWQPRRSGGERHLLSDGFHLSTEVAMQRSRGRAG